jgi:hypothetical protein
LTSHGTKRKVHPSAEATAVPIRTPPAGERTMPEPKFTPGPWSCDAGDVVHDGFVLAMVYGADDLSRLGSSEAEDETQAECHANARLITASPAMYAALRAVLLFHTGEVWDADKQRQWADLTGKPEASTKALCDVARAALALAEGE